MGCRYCEEDIRIETQEHLKKWEGFLHEQRNLNLDEEKGKLIFWRRMAPKFKKLDDDDKYVAMKAKLKRKRKNKH